MLKRFCAVLLALLCALTLMVFPVSAEELTELHIKIVYATEHYYEFAASVVDLVRYEDDTGANIIEELGFETGRLHQVVYKTAPGWYQIPLVMPCNVWRKAYKGSTDIFEVKGAVMTVYVVVKASDEEVTPPPSPVVYGKDDYTFGIWAVYGPDNGELWDNKPLPPPDTTETTDTTQPETSSEPPETITVNSAEVTISPQDRQTREPQTTVKPRTNEETKANEEPITKRIGSIVFGVVLGIAALICGGVLLVLKAKKR